VGRAIGYIAGTPPPWPKLAPEERALYRYLRLVTCACLIGFTGIVALGAAGLIYRSDERAKVPPPQAGAFACALQSWPHLDQGCLSRRSAPPVMEAGPTQGRGASAVRAAAHAAPDNATEPRPSAPPRAIAAMPADPVPQTNAETPEKTVRQPSPVEKVQPAAPPSQPQTSAAAPALSEAQHEAAPRDRAGGAPERRASHVPKESVKPKAHERHGKKTARRELGAKRLATRGSRPERRPGETWRDDAMGAYATDTMQRPIPVRPTSVQDLYYYSRPR
jgi:hypothetical protein